MSTLTANIYAPERVQDGSTVRVLSHDEAGNRLADGKHTIHTNLRGKPSRIVNEDNSIDSFEYATSGQRYLRRRAKLKMYVRNDGYSPIAEVNKDGTGAIDYVFYLRDHLGSVLATTNDSGVRHDTRRYNAWGNSTSTSGSAVDQNEAHRGFTGHENMAAPNFIHMNGRVYDPAIGLFLSPDPVISRMSLPGLNKYAYGYNSGVNWADPTGFVSEAGLELTQRARRVHHQASNITRGQMSELIMYHHADEQTAAIERSYLRNIQPRQAEAWETASTTHAATAGIFYMGLAVSGNLSRGLEEAMNRLTLSSVEQWRSLAGGKGFALPWSFLSYFTPNFAAQVILDSSNVGYGFANALSKTVVELGTNTRWIRQNYKNLATVSNEVMKVLSV